MNDGENRLNQRFIDAFSAALDAVEAVEGPCALVTTGGGKFYSNGLDLDWLASGDADPDFIEKVHGLLHRLLTFDRYTVAAVNGHAFAAGAMLATAHDCVLIRHGRGYWCLPEVDLGLPLSPEMFGVLAAHLPRPTLADAALTGRRYTAEDAVAAGIAREVLDEDALLNRAIEIAADAAGKSREVIRVHKALLAGSQPA